MKALKSNQFMIIGKGSFHKNVLADTKKTEPSGANKPQKQEAQGGVGGVVKINRILGSENSINR